MRFRAKVTVVALAMMPVFANANASHRSALRQYSIVCTIFGFCWWGHKLRFLHH
jgi:threonine/homoserine/homoserine lactone efflux protein